MTKLYAGYFFWGLSLSQNNEVGGPRRGGGVEAFCRTNVELGWGFLAQYSACRTCLVLQIILELY